MNEKYQEIKEQFIEVIRYSQHIPNPQVDKLFNLWEKNKRYYIDCFHSDLKVTLPEPVTFELDEKEKLVRISELLGLVQSYGCKDLYKFIQDLSINLYDNKMPEQYCVRDILIPKGSKIVKAFKYFESDKMKLQAIQNLASELIQENKVTGYLTMSVHPLDYLSLSENAYNWRSCHALNGDYRSGNLAYMIDTSTVICYLSPKEQVKLPRFPENVPWNSKKWRVLLYLSNDNSIAFAGKQYPYRSDCGLELIKKHFLPLLNFERLKWSNWSHEYITHYTDIFGFFNKLNEIYVGIDSHLMSLSELFVVDRPQLHYNDVLYSSTYNRPDYIMAYQEFASTKWVRASQFTQFHVGDIEVPCLECEDHILSSGEQMVCSHCGKNIDESMQETCCCN